MFDRSKLTERNVRKALRDHDQEVIGMRKDDTGRRYFDPDQARADRLTLKVEGHILYKGVRGHLMERMGLDSKDKQLQAEFNEIFNRVTGFRR